MNRGWPVTKSIGRRAAGPEPEVRRGTVQESEASVASSRVRVR